MDWNIQTRRATFNDIRLIAFLYIWLLIRATLEEVVVAPNDQTERGIANYL